MIIPCVQYACNFCGSLYLDPSSANRCHGCGSYQVEQQKISILRGWSMPAMWWDDVATFIQMRLFDDEVYRVSRR